MKCQRCNGTGVFSYHSDGNPKTQTLLETLVEIKRNEGKEPNCQMECPFCKGTGQITPVMCKCPACKGKGKQTIKVFTNGKKSKPFKMPCDLCKETGKITARALVAYQKSSYEAAKLWCRCGNKSGDVTYHPDEEGSKHHYTCNDCGKVTQVG